MILRLAVAILLLFCTTAQSWRALQLGFGAVDCCSESYGAHSAESSTQHIPCRDPNAACCLGNACYQATVMLLDLEQFITTMLPVGAALPLADRYYRQRPLLTGILRPPIA